MQERQRRGPKLVGIVLVVVGALLLLDNLGILHLGGVMGRGWPLLIVAAGVYQVVRERDLRRGWLPIVIGGVLLLATLRVVRWGELWRLWPILLVLLGVRLLLGWRTGSHRRSESSTGEDVLGLDALFSGVERRVTSRSFRGGKIEAVFGGVEVDFTQAAMAPEGGVLEVSAVFGGVELRLPRDWDVELRPSAVLGGVGEHLSQSDGKSGGRLVIKASAVFGGIELKN